MKFSYNITPQKHSTEFIHVRILKRFQLAFRGNKQN